MFNIHSVIFLVTLDTILSACSFRNTHYLIEDEFIEHLAWPRTETWMIMTIFFAHTLMQFISIDICTDLQSLCYLPFKIILFPKWSQNVVRATIRNWKNYSKHCTVHWAYYSDQSFGQNGEIIEKKWLYFVVNSPMVTYVSTKLHLVTPNGLKTEFGLFHSWPLCKSELLLLLGQLLLTKKEEEIFLSPF